MRLRRSIRTVEMAGPSYLGSHLRVVRLVLHQGDLLRLRGSWAGLSQSFIAGRFAVNCGAPFEMTVVDLGMSFRVEYRVNLFDTPARHETWLHSVTCVCCL